MGVYGDAENPRSLSLSNQPAAVILTCTCTNVTHTAFFLFIPLPISPSSSPSPSPSLKMSDSNAPLLESKPQIIDEHHANGPLSTRIWVESKQLWHIVGPAIFSRVASYSMLVITQAFAGHLGDLELAAMSIANNVIVGFDFGLLVISSNTFSAFRSNELLFFSSIFSSSWGWPAL